MTAAYATLALLLVAAVAVALAPLARAWRRARGQRLVTCPDTGQAAAVEVDPVDAAFHTALGTPEMRLAVCSRWPEREGCGQECLAEIDRAPDGCFAESLVERWYAGRSCALCGKPFATVRPWERVRALLDPDGATIGCSEVPAERLPEVLATHRPVCWDCHIVAALQRMYPEMAAGAARG